MKTLPDYYAIVIGAGAAGLVVAKGLAKAGKKVLLIDKGPYGGDCANFGCIPTQALITSANIAHELWRSGLYGIDMRISNFQSHRVFEQVRQIVEEMRQKNSPEALKALGIATCSSTCTFIDSHTVQVTTQSGEPKAITADQIIIATGSRANVPLIKGLEEVSYHTNETIFTLNEIPTTIAIIGGGQTGCELAQAFRRLGSSVTLIEQSASLVNKMCEPEALKAVQSTLIKEGVEIYLGNRVERVRKDGDRISLYVHRKSDDVRYELHAQHILVATGRKPNIEELQLEAAGVTYTADGIVHDLYGRTTAKSIWVVGDASGESFYTHAAINQARSVLYNILLPWPFKKKVDIKQAVPSVIYTDPGVASIGLTEAQALEQYGAKSIMTYIVPLSEADFAHCQRKTDGFVKFVTKRLSSKILGATIVAPIAADMLVEVAYAMRDKVPLRKLSSIIHPYPTYSQIIHKAADKWFSDTILPIIGKLFS